MIELPTVAPSTRRPIRLMLCRRLLALVLLAPAAVAASNDDILLLGRVDHVADGDTLTLSADHAKVRVRLYQIDAPEHGQPGGTEARRALADKVEGKYVRVEVETTDDYGRIVGTVLLGEVDVNREMVREGHAWAYRDYLEDRSLLADERAARRAKRGLWGLPDPVAPWEWRHSGRTDAGGAAQKGCRIKGNINRRGERIYHVPGGRYYAQTRIDTAAGERWFCSPAEAERAGWRRVR